MFSSISISALFYILQIVAVRGAKHPAFKRQTFQDLCGASGVDCGNGWCCMVGQECVDADPEPLCADNILTEFGGDPLTMLAYPFASLNAAQSSDDAALTSLINDLASAASITISIPSLASTETPSGFTGFQTYTDNILPSISTFSIKETPSSTKGQGAESTALAKRKEIAVGMMAGGVVVGAAGALAGM